MTHDAALKRRFCGQQGLGCCCKVRELKEETTIGLDATAVPIGHEETTSVAAVHPRLKTLGRLAGAGSRGYGPEMSYHRALILAGQMAPIIAAAVHCYNF